jgi:hypothetical protein
MCSLNSNNLTVYYDCPFWVGIFEERFENTITVCRIVFGSEPKDCEVYTYINNEYYSLLFSRPVPIDEKTAPRKINPKRLQRQIKKQIKTAGVGTKAQNAIKKEYELRKAEHKVVSKINKEKEKKKLFEKKQYKKKMKRKGH